MKAQKQAVIDEVVAELGTSFTLNQTNALASMTHDQLENIKNRVEAGILNGTIKYGKEINIAEVKTYARSMVMNHLKKATELNGGQAKSVSVPKEKPAKEEKYGINKDILPDELKAIVEACGSTQ